MATKPNHALIYRTVPTFLRGAREASGMTQRQLAAKIKRPQWWVARIETGSRRVDIAEFIVFVEACGLDAADCVSKIRHRN